jgi:Zn-dependent peptidase ImmA (M78 family)
MRKEDSELDPHQLATVLRHSDQLLRDAAALGRFPTPIDDIMDRAKLTVVDDEVLDESVIRQFAKKAKAGLATIKSALSKILGLFEAQDRLVVIDKDVPDIRVPFIKLHEAGHGTLPHQSKVYKLIHDCEKTLDPDVADLFEREANVFASEVLFQGDVFQKYAGDLDFSIKAPIALARKFGASNYASFRRYVKTNPHPCCVVVLEPANQDDSGTFSSEVRRVVMSKSFAAVFADDILSTTVRADHPLYHVVPRNGHRMTFQRDIILADRNGDQHLCIAEAFDTKHQVLILIRDYGRRSKAGILFRGPVVKLR